MKNSEVHEISAKISKELRLYSDPIRLAAPLLLTYAKNKLDFFVLFELSKFQSTRNQILGIIKKDQDISDKLSRFIKKKSNKSILNRVSFTIQNLKLN